MNELARNGRPVTLDQILGGERGREKTRVACSADHDQDWQPYRLVPRLLNVVTNNILYIMTIHS